MKTCPRDGSTDFTPAGDCRECRRRRQRLKAKRDREARAAARETWDPHSDAEKVAAGYIPRGTSTLRKADGSIALQWQKTERDPALARQAILDAFADVVDDIPVAPLVPPPATADRDLLACYPSGDWHFGMRAWAKETRDRDFDLSIARACHLAAVDKLVSEAPPARTAIILPLGDTAHGDDSTNKTRRSGHVLDMDGRYAKVIRVIVDTCNRTIQRALEKHERVVFKALAGNHDDDTALWLNLCMQQRWSANPRVAVSCDPSRFWYFRFGASLIGATHGDTVQRTGPNLAEIMMHDRPHSFAEAKHRYWYVGHVHHRSIIERPGSGVLVETFRTLAARDFYASSHGYRSGQDMRMIAHHRLSGECMTHRVGIEQVIGAAA